jgi:hypothetical protein
MDLADGAKEGWIIVAANLLLGTLMVAWRASFGTLKQRVDVAEKAISQHERECDACRLDNSKNYITVKDHDDLITHIDVRFKEQREFFTILISNRGAIKHNAS